MDRPHPPYDPYYFAPPPTEYRHPPNEREGISTLFVGGLPDDIKAREIHNLFRRRPGFEFCQLKYTGRGNQVVAFATFLDPQSAMEALISLNGVKFDPESDSTLFVELARTNSRRTYDPGNGPYVVIDNRGKMNINSAPDSSKNDKDSDSDDSAGEENADKDSAVNGDDVAGKEQEDKRADGSCSTLFIANLGPTCTDTELEQVLSQYPGFNSSKVQSRGGMPVAFADFEGIEQATEAMNALQGSTLPSSDRGGMHIEYAKSKMRKR